MLFKNSFLNMVFFTTFLMITGCGGGNNSSNNQNSGGDGVEKLSFPELSVEYKGEIKGTLSGDLNEEYQREVTILFTPKQQYYLRTLTTYIGSNMNEGEVSGILDENESIHEVVNNKEELFVGKTFFSIFLNNNSLQLKSTAGSTKIINVSIENFSAEVDISLEGKNSQNETIQVSLKGKIEGTQQSPTLHYLSDFVMNPVTPNDLLIQDIVYIDFNYHTIESDGVRLWNEPSVQGGSYSVNGSPAYPKGDGKGQVSFQISSVTSDTATVDSTTILMISADQKRVLVVKQIPLSYTYFQ